MNDLHRLHPQEEDFHKQNRAELHDFAPQNRDVHQ